MILKSKLKSSGDVTVEPLEIKGQRERFLRLIEVDRGEKPVIDLFSYYGSNNPKFDALSKAEPNRVHLYVGTELDPDRERTNGRDWEPDKENYGLWKLDVSRGKRVFSSRLVDDVLKDLPDNSVNRINIDYVFMGADVIRESLRVLEPGGALEYNSCDSDGRFQRAFKELRNEGIEFNVRDGNIGKLDMQSNHLRGNKYGNIKPKKYVIEKPGGDESVDRRSFDERLTKDVRDGLMNV